MAATLKSRIPDIVARSEAGAAAAVERAGLRVEAGAKARARVRTGFMRGEIQWHSHGPFEGEVIAGADYTIYNEYGTRYMSAQPMFVPAAEDAREAFVREIRELFT